MKKNNKKIYQKIIQYNYNKIKRKFIFLINLYKIIYLSKKNKNKVIHSLCVFIKI